MTEQDATKIVILLVATFPTPSWEKQTMQVYREMLVDLDAAATRRSCATGSRRTTSAPPSPLSAVRWGSYRLRRQARHFCLRTRLGLTSCAASAASGSTVSSRRSIRW